MGSSSPRVTGVRVRALVFGKVVTKYLSLQNGFLAGISSGKLYLLKDHIQGFLKDSERSMMVVLLLSRTGSTQSYPGRWGYGCLSNLL